jgi:uncharacterized protein (DUF1810 family)
MWFIFPQIRGLGLTETSAYYAIKNLEEARVFIEDPILGRNLRKISNALLNVDGKTANEILGSPDDKKLHSSMTLFSLVSNDPIFNEVLAKYYNGKIDVRTTSLINADKGI